MLRYRRNSTILLALVLLVIIDIAMAIGQESNSVAGSHSDLSQRRVDLQNEVLKFWENGNVSAALEKSLSLLKIEEELFGPASERVASRYGILCNYALELDQTEQAEQFAQEAARVYREGRPPESWQHVEAARLEAVSDKLLARPLSERQELFGWHRQLQQAIDDDQPTRAMEAAENFARINRDYFGERHPLSILAMAFVHATQVRLGQLETVSTQLDKLRIDLQHVEHRRHPNHAVLLYLLAEQAVSVGEFDESLKAATQAIEHFQEAGDTYSVNYLTCLTLKGYLLVVRGDFKEALPSLREAYATGVTEGISQDRLQTIAEQLCFALQQVAHSEWEQQNWKLADQLMREAYQMAVDQWGEDNFRTIDLRIDPVMTTDAESWTAKQRQTYEQIKSLNQEMLSLSQAGKKVEAVAVAKQRYALLVELFGRTNAETLRGRFDVLILLVDPINLATQDHERLRSQITEYLRVLRTEFGKGHREYATACMEFASRLDSDDPMMLELTRKALDGFREALTEKSEEYAEALTVLGCILAEQSNDDAEEYLLEAKRLWEEKAHRGGYTHCQAVATLGVLYYNFDDAYESRHLLVEAADLLRANTSDNVAYDLAVVLNSLGNISADQERFSDALKYYQEALSYFETGQWFPIANRFGKALDDYTATYQWCLYNAANSHERVGQFDEAQKLLNKLIARYPEDSPLDSYRSALYTQAVVYARLDRFDDAEKVLSKVQSIIDEHYEADPVIRGKFYLVQGRVALIVGRETMSLDRFDRAFEQCQKITDLRQLERIEWGYFDTSLLQLRQSYEKLQAWDQIVNVREFAASSEAILYADWPDVLTTLQQELELARRVNALKGDELDAYEQLLVDTKALAEAQSVDAALLERSTNLIERNTKNLGPFNLANMDYARSAASYYERREDYAQALKMSSLAVSCGVNQLGSEHSDFIPLATQQSRLLRLQGRYQEALALAEQCILAAEATIGNDSYQTFAARFELARISADIQDYASALPLAQAASEGFWRLWGDENIEYAKVLRLLGEIYYGIGEPDLAHSEIARSYEITERLQDVSDRDRLRAAAALAMSTASEPARFENAREQFERVVSDYEKAGLSDTTEFVELLIHFGDALMSWNAVPEAEQLFERARMSTAERSPNPALEQSLLQKLGIAQRKRGGYEEAHASLSQALDLQLTLFGSQAKVVAETLFQLAIVEHHLGKVEMAVGHVKQCLEIEEEQLSDAARLLSETSLTTLLDEDERPLDLLIALLAERPLTSDEIQMAFEWTVRRKGLALDLNCRVKALEQSQSFDTQTLTLMEKLRLLNQEVADLTLRRDDNLSEEELAEQRRQLKRSISETRGQLDRRLRDRAVALPQFQAEIDEIASQLGEREALIEYLKVHRFSNDDSKQSAQRYVAFCLHQGSEGPVIEFADLGDADEIDKRIEQLRDHTRQVPRLLRLSTEADLEKTYQELARELHGMLVGSILKQVPKTDTLIIGPDAEISKIPFGALVDEHDRYLVQTKDISYISSARDLLRTSQSPGVGTLVISNPNFDADINDRQRSLAEMHENTSENLLALRGQPDLGTRSLRWKRLPGAEKEADDVQSLLAESRFGPVATFLGDDAVEEVFKSAHSVRVLHLATHGFYVPPAYEDISDRPRQRSLSASTNLSRLRNNEQPLLRSGIVLAGANRVSKSTGHRLVMEDGWVTAQEIARMDFRRTELVVLSACESGLGDVSSGQGVHGLRRAFLNAGAHSVLTTLFEVPDAETRELMRDFYQHLLTSPNRRAAVCEAQRHRIEARRAEGNAAHPFFWASFVLLGRTDQALQN